jgi:hypothetical protein
LTYLAMLPFEYFDMCFHDNKIYLLSIYNQLLIINNDSTYSVAKNVKTYCGDPLRIFITDTHMYIVIQTDDGTITIDKIQLPA